MMVRLKVFAAAKEIVGDGHVELELVQGARVSDLKTALVRHVPELDTLVGLSLIHI